MIMDGRDLLPLSCFWADGPAITDSTTSEPVMGVSMSVMDLGGPLGLVRAVPLGVKILDIYSSE